MIREQTFNTYHEVLDLIEEAHRKVEKIDGPTAQHLHLAKCQLESVLARDMTSNARELWRNRPRAAGE